MQFRKSVLAAAIISTTALLTACEGDDGATGADGQDLTAGQVSLVQVGRFAVDDNEFDESAAEIVAYDPASARVFVVNAQQSSVDVLDLQDPANPTKQATLDATVQWADAGAINSVSVSGGLVAVAVEHDTKTSNGRVQIYNAADLQFRGEVEVGALPDMLTFTPDGTKILVANEGEPNGDYSIDPEGTVSIVDATDPDNPAVESVSFADFNVGGSRADELPEDVRVFGNFGRSELAVTAFTDTDPASVTVDDASAVVAGSWLTIASTEGDPLPYRVASVAGNTITLTTDFDGDTEVAAAGVAGLTVYLHDGQSSVAQDFEPEYVAVSPDGSEAWVTLQENNAVAVVDIAQASVKSIVALGTKNHGIPGNELDVSDKDDAVNITSWPVKGMYMPDSIKAIEINGEVYYLTANEGDAREYDAFVEEIRFEDAPLADVAPFNLGQWDFTDETGVGRLTTTLTADTDGDGELDQALAFGGRSFSILNSAGQMIADSGNQFEVITANLLGDDFNNDNDENSGDSRSDAKGPEPEAIEAARINGHTYAFIGLERTGGIMVYDISNPYSPEYVQYLNNRDFDYAIEDDIDDGSEPAHAAGDLGPESILYVSAADAPGDRPLLIVGNEVSGTTTIYEIR
ncbi:MAG: alkaline phosphatase [Gammaproteobacteria bacterium]|nr:MAG: alkaline phosphatase [Gammaproteobacteria bacterium]